MTTRPATTRSSHFHLNLSESSAALQTGNDVLCRYDHMILHIPSKIPGQSQLPDLAHPCNLATSPPGDPYSLASHPEKQRMVEKETLTNQHQQTTSNSDILLTAALDHIHHDPHPLPRDDSPGPGMTALGHTTLSNKKWTLSIQNCKTKQSMWQTQSMTNILFKDRIYMWPDSHWSNECSNKLDFLRLTRQVRILSRPSQARDQTISLSYKVLIHSVNNKYRFCTNPQP